MDIWLALVPITHNTQARRISAQSQREIVADAVRHKRTDNVGESEDRADEIKHVAVGADKRFRSQFRRTIGRDRHHVGIFLRHSYGRNIAVYAAPRSEQYAL